MKQLIKKILIRIFGPVLRAVLHDDFQVICNKSDNLYSIMQSLQQNITKENNTHDEFELYMSKIDWIHIEPTNICNYHCIICPHDNMTRKQGIMSIQDFDFCLDNLASYISYDYSGIIFLTKGGEPLLDKILYKKILAVRQRFPQSNINVTSTLGGGGEIQAEIFENLIKNGLNVLNVSIYGIDKYSYQEIHGVDRFDCVMIYLDILEKLLIKYNNSFSVNIEGPFDIKNADKHEVFRKQMIDKGFNYRNITLHNYGKLDINPVRKFFKPCSVYKGRLSRVLTITWDLNVVPCAMIMNNEIIFGNLHEKSLREIYYDTTWTDFRNIHKHMQTKEKIPFYYKCHQDSNVWGREDN